MENFIFDAVRSVYSIKWNPLDGQDEDARWKKMFLRIKRKNVASSSHIPYATIDHAFFCCVILVIAVIMEH